MKKIVILTTVIFTLLSMQVCFASYTDIKYSKYEEAIEYLCNASIIKGYEDNTYRPDKVVTRAEMATLITRILYDETSIETSFVSNYNDVSTNYWALKYINQAQKDGYIKGDGNGNFRPDDTVNYAEAVTMIIRMLGYDEGLDEQNNWPMSYINKAEELDLFYNVDNVNNTDGSNRGSIAQLLYNGINKVGIKSKPQLNTIMNNIDRLTDIKVDKFFDESLNLDFEIKFDGDEKTLGNYIIFNNSKFNLLFEQDSVQRYGRFLLSYFFKDEKLLTMDYIIDNDEIYIGSKELFDGYYYYENINNINQIDTKYINLYIKPAILKNLKNKDMTTTSYTENINGKNEYLDKITINLTTKDINNIYKDVLMNYYNDEEAITRDYKMYIEYYGYSYEEIKEELINNLEDLVVADEKLSIDIYIKPETNAIVGFDTDINIDTNNSYFINGLSKYNIVHIKIKIISWEDYSYLTFNYEQKYNDEISSSININTVVDNKRVKIAANIVDKFKNVSAELKANGTIFNKKVTKVDISNSLSGITIEQLDEISQKLNEIYTKIELKPMNTIEGNIL